MVAACSSPPTIISACCCLASLRLAVRRAEGDTRCCRMFTLLGPAAEEYLGEWRSDAITSLQENEHMVMDFDGAPVIVFKSSGLGATVPGWTFIVSENSASEFWRKAALKVRLQLASIYAETASVPPWHACASGFRRMQPDSCMLSLHVKRCNRECAMHCRTHDTEEACLVLQLHSRPHFLSLTVSMATDP